MVSLLNPSPGEIYDRLSIIALKIESGNTSPHLVIEHQALSRRLIEIVAEKVTPEIRDKFNAALNVEKLAAVNAFIWHKEDAIRNLAQSDPNGMMMPAACAEMGETAIVSVRTYMGWLAGEIRKLADRRHHLIAEIDKLFGEERAGKEKSWMAAPASPPPPFTMLKVQLHTCSACKSTDGTYSSARAGLVWKCAACSHTDLITGE